MILGILVFIGGLIAIYNGMVQDNAAGPILGLIVCSAGAYVMYQSSKAKKYKEELAKSNEMSQSTYEKSIKSLSIPSEAQLVTCGYLPLKIWKENDDLNLFLAPQGKNKTKGYIDLCHKLAQSTVNDRLSIIKLPVSGIDYYTQSGEVRYETKVSGGGSSVGGAIAGSLLAGDTGAVIGSRKGITSETIEHDTRETIFCYEGLCFEFAYSDFETFKKLVPEKNKDIVDTIEKQALVKNHSKSTPVSDIETRLQKLKSLLDSGHITEEEYKSKRESILEEI